MAKTWLSMAKAASGSRHLKPRNGTVARSERIHVGSQALEKLHVQITERRVLLRIEGEVPAVSETSAGDEDRHVLIIVAARIAEVAAEHHDGAVQQRAPFLMRAFQPRQKFAEERHLLEFQNF